MCAILYSTLLSVVIFSGPCLIEIEYILNDLVRKTGTAVQIQSDVIFEISFETRLPVVKIWTRLSSDFKKSWNQKNCSSVLSERNFQALLLHGRMQVYVGGKKIGHFKNIFRLQMGQCSSILLSSGSREKCHLWVHIIFQTTRRLLEKKKFNWKKKKLT
jgi:hypothetical protein